eukprot:g1003.t1
MRSSSPPTSDQARRKRSMLKESARSRKLKIREYFPEKDNDSELPSIRLVLPPKSNQEDLEEIATYFEDEEDDDLFFERGEKKVKGDGREDAEDECGESYAKMPQEEAGQVNIRCKGVSVVYDEEIRNTCLSVTTQERKETSSYVSFDVNIPADYEHVCMYIKGLNRFAAMDIRVEDEEGNVYVLSFSNKRTLTKIRENKKEAICEMPFVLKHGWNHLNFDVATILKSAFGKTLRRTLQIRVASTCRLYRCFFQISPRPYPLLPRILKLN